MCGGKFKPVATEHICGDCEAEAASAIEPERFMEEAVEEEEPHHANDT
jgi:hypothetical protein